MRTHTSEDRKSRRPWKAGLRYSLDRLAGLVSSLHETVEVQRAELNDLSDWRHASPQQVAHQVVSLAGILSVLSSAVTIGPSLSSVDLNIVGVLADILMVLGA